MENYLFSSLKKTPHLKLKIFKKIFLLSVPALFISEGCYKTIDGTVTLTGTIIDRESGKPVAGADAFVLAYEDNQLGLAKVGEALSGPDGKYTLKFKSDKKYTAYLLGGWHKQYYYIDTDNRQIDWRRGTHHEDIKIRPAAILKIHFRDKDSGYSEIDFYPLYANKNNIDTVVYERVLGNQTEEVWATIYKNGKSDGYHYFVYCPELDTTTLDIIY